LVLIDEEMRRAGMSIAADARTLLVSLIGGDRRASRSEISKLALYALGRSSIEVADAMTPDDEVEASFRGVISIANAEAQLGWTPRYASLREGDQQYIDTYRSFRAQPGGTPT